MTSILMAIVMLAFFQPILDNIDNWKVYFENLGQGHWVRHSQLRHSIANINLDKSYVEHFCASSYRLFCEIGIFQNSLPWKYRLMSWCTILAVAPFDVKCMTCYLMAIIMFAVHPTVFEIFVKQEKCQNWPWKWSFTVKKKNGTCSILLEMSASMYIIIFWILATWEHTSTQKIWHTHTHTQRETGVLTIGKICNADLYKKRFGLGLSIIVQCFRDRFSLGLIVADFCCCCTAVLMWLQFWEDLLAPTWVVRKLSVNNYVSCVKFLLRIDNVWQKKFHRISHMQCSTSVSSEAV